MQKYIFVNGVMKLNPAYQAQQGTPNNQASNPQALAVVSSTQDVQDAGIAQEAATGKPMQVAETTIASIEIMQDPDYLNKFKTPSKLDGGNLLDGLSQIFAKYEVPIGLINKLLALTEYKLNFIVDDSGSMNSKSDLLFSAAHPALRQMRDPQGTRSAMRDTLTRWEEAEDRIHIMLDMLAYLPIDQITISFLNNTCDLTLTHAGKTPEQFAQESHQEISRLFSHQPSGMTPLYQKLSQAFRQTSNTMHYLFTDGEPSDATPAQVKQLVLQRPNPKMNPLTFISCTSSDEDAEWMKEIEEQALYTSELDDFDSERREVLKDQGPAFPFTRGFWLICQLVAAINPFDLDALDESVPFTKKTMNDLMGRTITEQEYRQYWLQNPYSGKYAQFQHQFEREDILAHEIIRNQKMPVANTNSSQGYPQPSQPMYPGQSPMYSQSPYAPSSTANNNIGIHYQPPYQNTPQMSYGNSPNTFFNSSAQVPRPTQPLQQPTHPYSNYNQNRPY